MNNWPEEYFTRSDPSTKRELRKHHAKFTGVHVPNKNESKMLRKLKKETGLTEKQLRDIKKYRVMLSEAQDKGEKEKTRTEHIEKKKKEVMKRITKELKLAKEHPKVVEAFNKEWAKYSNKLFLR